MSWDRFIKIEGDLGVRRTLMVAVVLWMTWKSFEWAVAFSYVVVVKTDNNLMLAAAGLVGAVTAPISWLTKTVIGMYFNSKVNDAPGDSDAGAPSK